jgi:membrane protein required for colicin V production
MNFVDILILIPLGYAAWKGFQHGLIIEIFTLLALLVGIYAGVHFSDFTASWLKNTFNWQSDYLPVVAFTLTFLGIGAMVYFAGKMLEQVVKVTNLTPVNKFFGIVFAVLKMLYFVSVFLVVLESYDEKGDFLPPRMKKTSLLYQPLLKISTTTIPALKNSTIFLKNALQSDSDSTALTVDQAIRAKEIADSLGIDAEDGKALWTIYQEYEVHEK